MCKRASRSRAARSPSARRCPKTIKPDDLTLQQAIALLSLPREVAKHPTSGDPIVAGIGRFGPYVQHGKTYANIGRDDDVLTIGANRAIDLIVAKEQGGGARFGASNDPGRVIGDHPDGGAVSVKAGRYGPYVNWGKINATLPKGTDAAAVTLEQAIPLLAAKAAGGGGTRRRTRARRTSGRRRHHRARGALWPLREPRQGQRDAAQGHEHRRGEPRRGDPPDRGKGRPGEEEGAGEEGGGEDDREAQEGDSGQRRDALRRRQAGEESRRRRRRKRRRKRPRRRRWRGRSKRGALPRPRRARYVHQRARRFQPCDVGVRPRSCLRLAQSLDGRGEARRGPEL